MYKPLKNDDKKLRIRELYTCKNFCFLWSRIGKRSWAEDKPQKEWTGVSVREI